MSYKTRLFIISKILILLEKEYFYSKINKNYSIDIPDFKSCTKDSIMMHDINLSNKIIEPDPIIHEFVDKTYESGP